MNTRSFCAQLYNKQFESKHVRNVLYETFSIRIIIGFFCIDLLEYIYVRKIIESLLSFLRGKKRRRSRGSCIFSYLQQRKNKNVKYIFLSSFLFLYLRLSIVRRILPCEVRVQVFPRSMREKNKNK